MLGPPLTGSLPRYHPQRPGRPGRSSWSADCRSQRHKWCQANSSGPPATAPSPWASSSDRERLTSSDRSLNIDLLTSLDSNHFITLIEGLHNGWKSLGFLPSFRVTTTLLGFSQDSRCFSTSAGNGSLLQTSPTKWLCSCNVDISFPHGKSFRGQHSSTRGTSSSGAKRHTGAITAPCPMQRTSFLFVEGLPLRRNAALLSNLLIYRALVQF